MDQPLFRSLHDLLLPDTAVSPETVGILTERLRSIADALEASLPALRWGHLAPREARPGLAEPSEDQEAMVMSDTEAEAAGELHPAEV